MKTNILSIINTVINIINIENQYFNLKYLSNSGVLSNIVIIMFILFYIFNIETIRKNSNIIQISHEFFMLYII